MTMFSEMSLLVHAQVVDENDHVEMQDATQGLFHDEIRCVNSNVLIGKYYSQESNILGWLPQGLASYTLIKQQTVYTCLTSYEK